MANLEYPAKDDPIGNDDLKIAVVPRNAPAVNVPGYDSWGEAFNSVFDFLGNNVMKPSGIIEEPWVRPGPAWKGMWVWDNALYSRIWSLCNLDFAKHVLDISLKFQATENPNDDANFGRIPHSIAPDGIDSWAHPPLLDWAFWELFKKNGSVDMLQQTFSRLFDYHLWLNYNRDLHKDGLYSWVHVAESGLENAPRFEQVAPTSCDAIDFSCLVSIQLRSLINMAAILKEDTVKEQLTARKQELDAWINEDLWDSSTGFYYDKAFTGSQKGQFIGPKAITGWYPLIAGIVPKERLAKYLRHLTNRDEFWTVFPVPSVAKDDPSFDKNMNMWRGATWVAENYFIIKGLKGYGFRQLPGELGYLTVAHVFDTFKKKRNFYEYYNSLGPSDAIELFSRKDETSGPRPYAVSGTGLVANILLEDILGIEPQHDSIMLMPSVPEKLLAKLGGAPITGSLSNIVGWVQDKIDFKMTFNAGDIIEYEFTLSKPMDIHVLEFSTREKLFTGDGVSVVQVEVKNNKDVISIFSKPEGQSIKEEFAKKEK
nr:trehalase family glycosidase [Candidatus Sigynarchaeota archaeon]